MKRILIAAHDRKTRESLEGALRAEKYDVATAPDGRAALKKLKGGKFDLILLDCRLPHLNGFAASAGKSRKTPHPKVIVITPDESPDTLMKALKRCASLCLVRPSRREDVIEAVHGSLDRKSCGEPIEVISARPDWLELEVPCSLDAANQLETLIARLETGLSEDIQHSITHAFHELLMNAIEWGGKLDPQRKVHVSFLRAKHMVLCRIADPGQGFKFTDLKHAAISHNGQPMGHRRFREEKGLRPGGFGLMLVRAHVDELLYNEAQNEVVFVKYLDNPRSDCQAQ
jgi:two-component system, OmpR family, response regulator